MGLTDTRKCLQIACQGYPEETKQQTEGKEHQVDVLSSERKWAAETKITTGPRVKKFIPHCQGHLPGSKEKQQGERLPGLTEEWPALTQASHHSHLLIESQMFL